MVPAMHLVYDYKLFRPACPILQAVLGGDQGIANRFDSDTWLTEPTEHMSLIEVTETELLHIVLGTEIMWRQAHPPEETDDPRLDGAKWHRVIGSGPNEGGVVAVFRMIFNDRICFGAPGDMTGFNRAFCFPRSPGCHVAIAAAKEWDGTGDPPGPWIKESGTERHRNPQATEEE